MDNRFIEKMGMVRVILAKRVRPLSYVAAEKITYSPNEADGRTENKNFGIIESQ